jgi:hypothetical protein
MVSCIIRVSGIGGERIRGDFVYAYYLAKDDASFGATADEWVCH